MKNNTTEWDRETYNQIADEDLQDLSLQAGAACKHLLQDADQDMAQRRTDERAIGSHLGHARREVVAALAPVLCDPGGEDLLQS